VTDTAPSRPRWRPLDGIVLLDKPAGIGSTPALQRVRRLLRAEKAGHAGTLDPLATGMLPLCFGQATKACGALLGAGKSYRARLRLGAATDTGDADGRTVRTADVPALDRGRAASVLAGLAGTRAQCPPMYSALKQGGRPLYELARRGEVVERAARTVTIRRLELLELSGEELEFEVDCSKGTYVRVLGEEIASALGTVGHLVALRRLRVDPFDPASMVSLEEVERWAAGAADADRPAWLLPVDAGFPDLARVDLDDGQARALRHGQAVAVPGRPEPGPLRAYDARGSFLGLVEPAAGDRVRVLRLFVAGECAPAAPPT
jgi:tRNA pseudouridine55 synthase